MSAANGRAAEALHRDTVSRRGAASKDLMERMVRALSILRIEDARRSG